MHLFFTINTYETHGKSFGNILCHYKKKFTVNGDLTKLGQNGHSNPEY